MRNMRRLWERKMKDKLCHEYTPWRETSDLLNIDECEFYAYQSGYCHCELSQNNLKPCVYREGSPDAKD
jgi:hypothetical protein